jgi:thiol-disulfide isomerase/thioredoxin
MKKREFSSKKWGKQIICIMLTAILLCGLSVSALAEEPEIKTFELAGVRFTIPAEFKNMHGVLEYDASAVNYTPPTYWITFSYYALSEEDLNVYKLRYKNGEVSFKEFTEFDETKTAELGVFYAVKGDVTNLDGISKENEIIELGSGDGFNYYYIKEFVRDAHSNWDKAFLEEAEMLSAKIVEMMKKAELFKPVDPAAEALGKKLTFKAEDLDHNWHTSEELFSHNRFTLVNIWGTWCGVCLQEMEDLGKLHKQLEEKKCGVLSIEHEYKKYEKYAQEAKDILKEKNVTYPNVLLNKDYEDLAFIYKLTSHPAFFIVNSEGVVVSPIYDGASASQTVIDKFTPILDKLLAE